MVSFWLDNPNILLNKNYITELWPNNDFDLERKLNSITRLIIILTILGYFLTKSQYIPVSAIVSIIILVIIYKTKSKSQQKESFVGTFTKRDAVAKDINKVLEREFTLPTKKNPLMNVLMTDYKENVNRKPAAPAYNDMVVEEINDNVKKVDKKLFKNLGDNLSFQHSMRNFYAMPNTQIPNNQKDFAEFCYGNMPSCKEGDSLQCSKNNALFRTT